MTCSKNQSISLPCLTHNWWNMKLLSKHPNSLKRSIYYTVTYWPSTESSIKRCTRVNMQKNSRSRWAWDNYITRCPRRFESIGDKMLSWEPAADRGLWALSDPWLSNPAKMRKKYCWINIAVFPHLQLISHTQPTSTLSRIKCERYIFIKKCVCSFIEVRHYVWLCFCIYLYMYAAIQQYKGKQKNSYDDAISAVDGFFDQWDPSTSTLMEEVSESQGTLCWKIKFTLSHSMRASWSVNEFYTLPSIQAWGWGVSLWWWNHSEFKLQSCY